MIRYAQAGSLINTSGGLYAGDFGVTANGITDDTEALQLAIDTAIYKDKTSLWLPPGIIKISSCIQVGYGVDFDSLLIRGQGRKYNGDSKFSGTVILATHINAPAFNIQGARETVLEDFTIVGQNKGYLDLTDPMDGTPPAYDDTVGTNWIDPALLLANPNIAGQFSVYAGVTIDAYCGVRPAISYPDVVYPVEFLGPGIPQYGKNPSSNVQLNRIEITGFVAGVVVQPCNASGNGDFLTLFKFAVANCVYGVAIGDSQSRGVGMNDVEMTTVWTCIDNVTFGQQIGHFGGNITNLNIGNCFQILNYASATGGVLVFTECFAENLFQIGTFGSFNSNDRTINFIGGQFGFEVQQFDTRGTPPAITAQNFAPIKFDGCVFQQYPYVLSFFSGYVILENCTFLPFNLPIDVNSRLAHNGTVGGVVLSQLTGFQAADIFQPHYNQYNVDTGSHLSVIEDVLGSRCSRANSPNAWANNFLPYAEGARPVFAVPYFGRAAIAKSTLASISLSQKTLTFTFTSRNTYTFATSGPLPGDVMFDDQTGTVFRVDSKSSLTLTATMLNNYKFDGVNFNPFVPFSTSVGNLLILNTRRYLVDEPLIATGTSGSGNLTSVGRGDGFFGDISQVQVNDWLLVDYYTDPFWTQSGTAGQVSAVNSGAGTMSLTGTATGNFTNKFFPPFVRQTS